METSSVVKETIKRTILTHKLIEPKSHIVLGLSGGPDSVCLFHVLKSLRQELDFSLHTVHVNHKFRPGAAEQDQAYVEDLCADSKIPCRMFTYDCNAMAKDLGLSSEEAGRRARYEAFSLRAEELIKEGVPGEQVKIAVAQNADDQAETILLRLLRGTGPDGLGGMSYGRLEGSLPIIRPLLDVWRKDIEAYCRAQGLAPCIDQTNLQPIYTRNKIRLELIPFLQERFNPSISQNLIRLGTIARQDKEYLWKQAEAEYSRLLRKEGTLDLEGLKALELPIRHRVIMKGFQEAGLTQDIGAVHLESADQVLEKGKIPGFVDFPGNYTMAFEKGLVWFYSKKQVQAESSRKCESSEMRDKKDLRQREGSGRLKQEEQELQRFGQHMLEKGMLWPEGISLRLKVVVTELRELPGSFNAKNSHTSGLDRDGSTFQTQRQQPLYRAVFDWDKLQAAWGPNPEIQLRTRQPGDYIRLKNGRKKIQNFFVDCKLPKEQRDHIPLAAVGSEVLWILSLEGSSLDKHRYSQGYLLDQTTKKALSLEIICEI